jgi:hypothetical protein
MRFLRLFVFAFSQQVLACKLPRDPLCAAPEKCGLCVQTLLPLRAHRWCMLLFVTVRPLRRAGVCLPVRICRLQAVIRTFIATRSGFKATMPEAETDAPARRAHAGRANGRCRWLGLRGREFVATGASGPEDTVPEAPASSNGRACWVRLLQSDHSRRASAAILYRSCDPLNFHQRKALAARCCRRSQVGA